MSLKQWPALTGINAAVSHPDADSWRAKFSCNLSSLIQLRSMVNVKKTEHMDSPAVFSDSYVIIKNDYDSNNAYALKDLLDVEGEI